MQTQTIPTMRRHTKVIKVEIPVVFGLYSELASYPPLGKRQFFLGWGFDFSAVAEIFSAFPTHNAHESRWGSAIPTRRTLRIMPSVLRPALSNPVFPFGDSDIREIVSTTTLLFTLKGGERTCIAHL